MGSRILNQPNARPEYPSGLWAVEDALLKARRSAASIAADTPEIGVSLSGGGLRSATFCLGALQGLARLGLLRRIDYLSTVSGGSYTGLFLSAMFCRGLYPAQQTPEAVEGLLREERHAGQKVWPVNWLRQNGRFLAPRGSTDVFRFFAIAARNWVTWQVVILSVLVSLATLLAMGGQMLGVVYASLDLPVPKPASGLSPWIPAALLSAAVAVLLGALYWPLDLYRLISSHQSAVLWARSWRTRLTSWLAGAARLTLILAGGCLIDSVARTCYLARVHDQPWGQTPLIAAVLAIAGTPALRWLLASDRVTAWLGQAWNAAPKLLLLWPLALLLWTLVLVAADWLGLWLLYGKHGLPGTPADVGVFGALFETVRGWPWALPGVLLAVQLLLMRYVYFLNRSSHHAVYAERLTRCFGGASNVERQRRGAASITEPMRDDDLDLAAWCAAPVHGAPLHLINSTLSETETDFAQTLLRDRNGIGLALGPAGVSAGVSHHALHVQTTPSWMLAPVARAGDVFRMFGDQGFTAEKLGMGYWTGISGAALATGLGSYGGRAQSLLLSFANLRLGYWWKSGCIGRLTGTGTRGTGGWRHHRPMQSYLFDEILGRFRGPHVGRWYLTDGGHFENTGALELLRRRLPYIVVIDTEASPDSPTANLAALVLKARQDYRAEIEFDTGAVPSPVGSLADLAADEQGCARRSIATACVRYADDPHTTSRLIYLRPLLAADDPADLHAYRRRHPAFPYQSTGDQFFDEAQWEAYRKLGERVALRAFTGCDAAAAEPLARLFGPYT